VKFEYEVVWLQQVKQHLSRGNKNHGSTTSYYSFSLLLPLLHNIFYQTVSLGNIGPLNQSVAFASYFIKNRENMHRTSYLKDRVAKLNNWKAISKVA